MDGINYLTIVRNQHIPVYCGACWAFASTSALSDRIKIMRKAQWPDIVLSPQVLVSCTCKGCHGGSGKTAYSYINKYYVSDETCSNYRARGKGNGAECNREIKCSLCLPGQPCQSADQYYVYTAVEYGTVIGEQQMVNEIYQRGPIVCSVDATMLHGYTGGIISEKTTISRNHLISVVGYGTEKNGTKYWIGRNSWGSFWGLGGFFKVLRGEDIMGIEESCHWAVPDLNPILNVTKKTIADEIFDTTELVHFKLDKFLPIIEEKVTQIKSKRTYTNDNLAGCYIKDESIDRTFDPSTFPWSNIDATSLPATFDWRFANKTNRLSWTRNARSPVYCGSCWVEAATSALSDIVNIHRKDSDILISMSPQTIINCNGGGNCDGGDPLAFFKFATTFQIPEDSCQNYFAYNPTPSDCSPMQICFDCHKPAPDTGSNVSNCEVITQYPNYTVSNFGPIQGAANMKAAIHNNGPIVCALQITELFLNNGGELIFEYVQNPKPNHIVSIVGWGNDGEHDYWIGRNSWGTNWGDRGYFYIIMGDKQYNLGVETDCAWATVSGY